MGHVLRNEGVSAVLQCVGEEAVHYVRLYAHLLCWTWTHSALCRTSDLSILVLDAAEIYARIKTVKPMCF